MAIKYAAKPVVSAPFGMTLAAAAKSRCMRRGHRRRRVLHGTSEVGVGLIPAGGGCKEMLLRAGDLKRAFELIGFAKVSTSAKTPALWACCAM